MIILDGLYTEKDFGLIALEEQDHPLSPELQNELVKIPGKIGLKYRNNTVGIRRFNLNFGIKDNNEIVAEKRLNTFYNFLIDDKGKPRDVKIAFDYEPDKYYDVRLDGTVNVRRIANYRSFTIPFIAADPHKYGSTIIINLTGDTRFYNLATAETKAITSIDVGSTLNHIKITNQNTGDFIYIEHNFIAGDEVIIDFVNENVTKNGYSIMKDLYLESDFFDINVGENRITSNVEGTLEFVERWL